MKATKFNIFSKSASSFLALFLFALSVNTNAGIDDIVDKSKAETIKERAKQILNGNSIGSHALGIGLGQTFLVGDFADNGDDSITVDLYYRYKASYSFDLFVNGHYSSHSIQEQSSTVTGLAAGIRGKVFDFDAFTPYVVAGLGFYLPKVTRMVEGQIVESETKVTFGNHLGVGGELELNNNFSVGVLGHYHNPFDIKQDVGPEVQGSYYKLLFTTLYSF